MASSIDRLITPREAAGMLAVQPQTLAKWRMSGKYIQPVLLGRNVRYRLSDVQRLIAEGTAS